MNTTVRLSNNGSGSLSVPSIQTLNLESNEIQISSVSNGYLKTNSGIISSESTIPI